MVIEGDSAFVDIDASAFPLRAFLVTADEPTRVVWSTVIREPSAIDVPRLGQEVRAIIFFGDGEMSCDPKDRAFAEELATVLADAPPDSFEAHFSPAKFPFTITLFGGDDPDGSSPLWSQTIQAPTTIYTPPIGEYLGCWLRVTYGDDDVEDIRIDWGDIDTSPL